MVNFIIKGKHETLSKEEIRAMLHATSSVLEFHKQKPIHINNNELVVRISTSSKDFKKCRKGRGTAVGYAWDFKGEMMIDGRRGFQDTFTTCIHEVIHLYNDWDDSETEKLTSTLTAKLKPTIASLYEILIKDVYKRSAYIAHTKIAYKPKGEDFYDQSQHDDIDITDVGKKYRKGKGKANICMQGI